ncbi:MAG: hypothetical protein K5900_08095, partial [Butyrivibrio sp.]|nr:hypothetical protein [Butyrivibrio sp.]
PVLPGRLLGKSPIPYTLFSIWLRSLWELNEKSAKMMAIEIKKMGATFCKKDSALKNSAG